MLNAGRTMKTGGRTEGRGGEQRAGAQLQQGPTLQQPL